MVNQKMSIDAKIRACNGNSKTNTMEAIFDFKTIDENGKFVKSNRARAIARLIFHLLDNRLVEVRDLGWLVLKYDLSKDEHDVRKRIVLRKKIIEEFEGN